MSDPLARQRQMVSQFPENELARFSLGKALYDRADFSGALTELTTALARKPDWMVVQILIGKCEQALGRRDAAKAAFQRARQLAIEQNHEGPLAEMDQLLSELH